MADWNAWQQALFISTQTAHQSGKSNPDIHDPKLHCYRYYVATSKFEDFSRLPRRNCVVKTQLKKQLKPIGPLGLIERLPEFTIVIPRRTIEVLLYQNGNRAERESVTKSGNLWLKAQFEPSIFTHRFSRGTVITLQNNFQDVFQRGKLEVIDACAGHV